MEVIISHDVDHLYTGEHWRKDLILEKFLVRSFLQYCKREIGIHVFWNRIKATFSKRYCRIPEILQFDREHGIPSSFFFGMGNILGMSYSPKQAEPWIKYVVDNGFDAGVHAANIRDFSEMSKEYNSFKNMHLQEHFGTRVHYVRYDDTTFERLASLGYKFDSSEFSKEAIWLKQPYPVKSQNGNVMWEFPLHVMDGNVFENNGDNAKTRVLHALVRAESEGVRFFTFLFHDIYFNEKTFPIRIDFYKWFVETCENRGYVFTSYNKAIEELENERTQNCEFYE